MNLKFRLYFLIFYFESVTWYLRKGGLWFVTVCDRGVKVFVKNSAIIFMGYP